MIDSVVTFEEPGHASEPSITKLLVERLKLGLLNFLDETQQVFRHLVDVLFPVARVLGQS